MEMLLDFQRIILQPDRTVLWSQKGFCRGGTVQDRWPGVISFLRLPKGCHLDLAIEGGYEIGTLKPQNGQIGFTPYPAGEEVDRRAWAGYATARLNGDKEFPNLLPWVLARFDYFSGDDPDSKGTYEGWDDIYAEWPKYSELMIYTFYDGPPFSQATHGTADGNLGVWTNMYFPTAEIGIRPTFGVKALDKKIWFRGQYRYMAADENNGAGGG